VPLPPAFEVRLAIYGVTPDMDRERREIWTLLDPEFDAIMNEHIARVIDCAPVYADNFRKHRAVYLETYRTYRSILSGASAVIGRRYRFSGRKVARLCDVALRVLLLDTANAVSSHAYLAAHEAKARSDQLVTAVQEFGQAVTDVRTAITGAVKSLEETSHRLSSFADAAATQTRTASAVANDTASGVEGTATATSELLTAIAEIRWRATKSAEMAHHSFAHAETTTTTIRSLSQAVDKIGSVVDLIADIAAQTNLLALNATIEAARAGEAGRGFSVVASEVKSLATQTAKATGEIGQQIALIQEATRRAVDGIEGTGKTIAGIAGIAEEVASSVDRQAAATDGIAETANRAATNAKTVAEALKALAEAVRHTQADATAVLDLSRNLSGRTTDLETEMNTLFIAAGRAGARDFVVLK
jgi:methyl-accepting chemotaxis protein